MSNFRPIDRDTGFLLPPSVDEWLPERHLARFVVEVVGGLDLRSMTGSYRGSGEASYHPELLLGLIVTGAVRADTISGTVKDPSGGVVAGARIEISGGNLAQPLVLASDESGRFTTAKIDAGKCAATPGDFGSEEIP